MVNYLKAPRKEILVVCCLFFIFNISQSFADFSEQEPVYYDDIIGVSVKFTQLSESSITDPIWHDEDPWGLYGDPSYNGGDEIEFDNLRFGAHSENGTGADTTDGKFQGRIESKNNEKFYVDRIHFQEWGDTTFNALAGEAVASVSNLLQIKIKEVDGAPISDIVEDFTMTFVPTVPENGWLWSEEGNGTFEWSGLQDIDVTQILRDHEILTGYATVVDFTMDNVLIANSILGTTSTINKKETDGLKITTETIPEPATIMLLGFGSLILLKKKK